MAQADNKPDPAELKPGFSIGAAGTLIFKGYITGEEYNQDLVGRKGLLIYDQMRKSDATVKAALNVVKLPIMSANWRVQSAGDEPDDQLVADFVHHNLFEIFSFEDTLRQMLTFLDFGFAVHEIVWNVIDWNGGSYVGLEGLYGRKQTTIWSWALDDGSFGVKQFVPGGEEGGMKEIPGDKFLLLTNDREGDNYQGISLLRPAYKHWYFKDALYKIDAISSERNGVGLPVITTPAGAKPEDISKAEELARNLRANEEAFLRIPEDFTFEFADFKGRQVKNLEPSIKHHDLQILKTVLAQFLNLGSADATGSYNLSTDQSRLFIQSLQWLAKYVAQVINQQLIPKLVDLNFADASKSGYPEVDFEKIGDDNLTVFSEALQKLVTAGLITPTPEDEEMVRSMFNLPDMPEGEEYEEDEGSGNDETAEAGGASNQPNDQEEAAAPSPNLDPKKGRSLARDIRNRKNLRTKILGNDLRLKRIARENAQRKRKSA